MSVSLSRDAAAAPLLDIGELVDRGRWTARQKLVLTLVGLAILFDGIDNQSLGLAAPVIIRTGTSPRRRWRPRSRSVSSASCWVR